MPPVHIPETRQALTAALACLEERTPDIESAMYHVMRARILLTGAHPDRIVGTDPSTRRPIPFPVKEH